MWEVMEAFLKEVPLIKHQLDSYNDFVNFRIQEIIENSEPIKLSEGDMEIRFHRCRLEQPKFMEADGSKRSIYPFEARLRRITYSAPFYIEMGLYEKGIEKLHEEIYCGQIPVMIKSNLCYLKNLSREELIKVKEDPEDPGGYFIIDGNEKFIVGVEDPAPNKIIVNKSEKPGEVVATIFCERNGITAKQTVTRNASGIYYVEFPGSPKNLKLFILILALGLTSQKEMEKMFDSTLKKNELIFNLKEIEMDKMSQAIEYIGKRIAPGQSATVRRNLTEYLLDFRVLPHIGTTKEKRLQKAYTLLKIAEKCMNVAFNITPEDDRDHYGNKRVRRAGDLLENLFVGALNELKTDLVYQAERIELRKRKITLKTIVRPDKFTGHIQRAMATGIWSQTRTGIAEILDRTCFMSAMSNLRVVKNIVQKSGTNLEMRELHGTHYGRLCPVTTPEGAGIGLTKHLAICGVISSGIRDQKYEEEIMSLGVEKIE